MFIGICCVDWPPSSSLSSWEPSFNQLMDDLSSADKTLLVLGDFNVNLLIDDAFAGRLKSDLHLSQLLLSQLALLRKAPLSLIIFTVPVNPLSGSAVWLICIYLITV